MDSRVLELTYTAIDMVGFAADLGYDGQPFAGTRHVVPSFELSSMPPASSFTALIGRKSSTSWIPFRISDGRMRPRRVSFLRNA